LEDLGINGKIILHCTLGKCGGMQMTQDRDQWQVLVNTVMNLQVP
jgi:hypothetical protein